MGPSEEESCGQSACTKITLPSQKQGDLPDPERPHKPSRQRLPPTLIEVSVVTVPQRRSIGEAVERASIPPRA